MPDSFDQGLRRLTEKSRKVREATARAGEEVRKNPPEPEEDEEEEE